MGDQTPFKPELERSRLTSGAEATIENLGEDHVVKTLRNDDPAELTTMRRDYQRMQSQWPDRTVKTLFVRGKDSEGNARNQMVQERIKGPTLRELVREQPETLRADADLRADLGELHEDVAKLLERTGQVPDVNPANFVADTPGREPRIKLIDFGTPIDFRPLNNAAGDPTLAADVLRDYNAQFDEALARSDAELVEPLDSLQHTFRLMTAAQAVRNDLAGLHRGNWKPSMESGVDEYGLPTGRSVNVLLERHGEEVAKLRTSAKSAEDFQRAVADAFGDEVRTNLEENVVGVQVRNPELQKRLTRALLQPNETKEARLERFEPNEAEQAKADALLAVTDALEQENAALRQSASTPSAGGPAFIGAPGEPSTELEQRLSDLETRFAL
jgi:hypothetical protein